MSPKATATVNLILAAIQIAQPLAELIIANLHHAGLSNDELNQVLLSLATKAQARIDARQGMDTPSIVSDPTPPPPTV